MQFEIEDVASLTCGVRLMTGAGQIKSSLWGKNQIIQCIS